MNSQNQDYLNNDNFYYDRFNANSNNFNNNNNINNDNYIIGIKFGSNNTVISTLNNRNIDVLYSDTSSRKIPSIITLFNNNNNKNNNNNSVRIYGELSKNLINKNINNTFNYLNRIILLENEEKNFIEHEKKFLLFDNNNNNFSNETIISSYFYLLSKTWRNSPNKKNTINFVLSIPDYYTIFQKIFLLKCIKISNLNCVCLLPESSAICLSYFYNNYNTLDNKFKNIIFIDLGDSKLSIHYCSFNNTNAIVNYTKTCKELGSRDFDYKIYEYIKENYIKDNKNIINNKKFINKLFNTIEKYRKILTVNNESYFNFEYNDDIIINFILNRDNFQIICEKEINIFKDFLKEFINNVSCNNLNDIEMVGDFIRNPIFQKIIYEIFNKNINKTLLTDECIARGCSLYNCMINENFSTINDFNFTQFNESEKIMKIKFNNDNNNKNNINISILKEGENYPIKKAFRFNKKYVYFNNDNNNINIELYEKENLIHIYNLNLSDEKYNKIDFVLVIEILININNFPKILDIYIENNNKNNKENNIEQISYDLIFDIEKNINSDLIKYKKLEIEMEFNDYINLSIINIKNEIESFLYKLRDNNNNNKNEFNINIENEIEKIKNINDIEILENNYKKYLNQNNNNINNNEFIDFNINKNIRDIINILNDKMKNNKINEETFCEFGNSMNNIINNFENKNSSTLLLELNTIKLKLI